MPGHDAGHPTTFRQVDATSVVATEGEAFRASSPGDGHDGKALHGRARDEVGAISPDRETAAKLDRIITTLSFGKHIGPEVARRIGIRRTDIEDQAPQGIVVSMDGPIHPLRCLDRPDHADDTGFVPFERCVHGDPERQWTEQHDRDGKRAFPP